MICLYNLHWYNVTKEKSYLYYAIFKAFIILIYLQLTQIFVINEFTVILNANFIFIFILFFSKEFLNLKINAKRINILINIIIVFIILFFLFSITTGDYSYYDLPYSLVLSPLVLLGFFIYRTGYHPAKFFTLGWGISLPLIGLTELNEYRIAVFYPDIPFTLISAKTYLIVKEKEEQSKILIHQAKLASMGHMLENISHQWRQPLNRISSFIINMQMHIRDKYKNEEYLPDMLNKTQLQIEYMSSTINDCYG